MNIKKSEITFCDEGKGIYVLAPNISNETELFDWIKDKKYKTYVNQNFRMTRHTRKRNRLYAFNHPILETEVILKISKIDSKYNFFRRVNLYISTFFNDYNFRAFKGACLLKNKGFACANPIAYWQDSNKLFSNTSYYLYEKIQADYSLHSFSQQLATLDKNITNELFILLAKKVTAIVRSIHDAGYRQGDPHPGNFLITMAPYSNENITYKNISESEVFIIDLDKFNKPFIMEKHMKRFFDLKCMRRCTLGPFNHDEMLKFYLQHEYTSFWRSVLKFWILGGFNILKWFKPPKRGR